MNPPRRRTLRIGQVSNCPLVSTQGSGYVINGFAEHMRARGHDVRSLGPDDYLPLRKTNKALRLRKLVGITRAALSLAADRSVEVLELWGAECWLATALLSRRRIRPLLVHRSNGLEPHVSEGMTRASNGQSERARRGMSPGAVLDRLQRPELAFRRADALTVVSDFDGAFARGRRYQPEERLVIINNPLEDSWLGRSIVPRRDPVIGFCGSWIPRKGIATLRTAFSRLARTVPEVRFLVCGVGGAFDAVRELPEVPASRLTVVPFAPREELASLYARMSVLINPSWFESFGLVSAEAMACGTPVVATPTGFAASFEHGREGWLAPFGDAEALTRCVIRALHDPAEREAVARRAWKRVQDLRWQDAAQTLESAYLAWLAAGKERT